MSNGLEFFYDYVSPYSYLANSQLGDFTDVTYRPMLLGAVMEAVGNSPPGRIKAKGKYMRNDIARWTKHYGLTFVMNPKFPQPTLKALRLALHAQHEKAFGSVHQALFEAMWMHEKDLSDDETLAGIAKAAGLDADRALAAIEGPDIKDALKANTTEAVERGAFGAPTFFVGDQMFFGNDRFVFIREALGA